MGSRLINLKESDAMLTTKISKKSKIVLSGVVHLTILVSVFKRKKVDRAIHGHDRETEGSSAKIMDEGTFDYTKSDACACSGIPRKAGENNSVSEEVTNTQKNSKMIFTPELFFATLLTDFQ